MRNPVVTFLSDFGTREYYTGAVKGAILSACPDVRIVDISHQVASHDLLEGAFTLLCSYPTFPQRSIHLAIVDPGVGSARRGLIVVTEDHYFIGPDNGVFSLIYQKEQISRVFSIEAEHHFRHPVAPTFHGRDIFAPVAGKLAKGLSPDNFGPEIRDFVKLALPEPRKVSDTQIEGIVIHIDKFGNVITSISPSAVNRLLRREWSPARFELGSHRIERHQNFYAEARDDRPFSLLGSSGYYEIATLKKPAARSLEARRGAKVVMTVE